MLEENPREVRKYKSLATESVASAGPSLLPARGLAESPSQTETEFFHHPLFLVSGMEPSCP